MSSKETINIFWFKRDLRLRDNIALAAAIEQTSKVEGRRLLLVYVFEPSLVNDPHYDIRHWRFVYESLAAINSQLKVLKNSRNRSGILAGMIASNVPEFDQEKFSPDEDWRVLIFFNEVKDVFSEIGNHYQIASIFSHKETGIKLTYNRDINFAAYCLSLGIIWKEFTSNGIIRRIKNRALRYTRWLEMMHAPQRHPDFDLFKPARFGEKRITQNLNTELPELWMQPDDNFQKGGEDIAQGYLNSFIVRQMTGYTKSLSKPLESRENSSRLSPYIAWGCLSVRQVFQATLAAKQFVIPGDKTFSAEINMFSSRIRCHGSFVQRFESNDKSELQDLNPAFKSLEKNIDQAKFVSWQTGNTGYPLVDACMRCLIQTGFINFRMRALLISFLTHHLFQDWQEGAKHLASLFLDFEPGIHYSQMQLQSGMGSDQIVRVYNPIKQSRDHDPKGIFIKKWVPELQFCEETDIHEPWKMPPLQQQLCKIIIGVNYPYPIVDIIETGKNARLKLYDPRKSKSSSAE